VSNHWMHRVLVICRNKANSILCNAACAVQRPFILKRHYSSLAKCKALYFSKKSVIFNNTGWNISRTDCNHSNASSNCCSRSGLLRVAPTEIHHVHTGLSFVASCGRVGWNSVSCGNFQAHRTGRVSVALV
jgi:hypothetical protein